MKDGKNSLGRVRLETGGWGLTAPAASALAALMVLVGGVAGAVISGYSNSNIEDKKGRAVLELEQKRFEINLILKAVEGQNQDAAKKALLFFADLGFIPAYAEKVRAKDSKDIPTIGLSLEETPVSRTTSFAYVTSANEIEPGRRQWTRIDDKHWTESYASGKVSRFISKTRIVLYGCSGTIVGNEQEQSFEVFVPDKSCPSASLWFRRVDSNGLGNWAYLKPIIDVK